MPTYDMICSECGHKFEVFRIGFIRPEDKVCPECGTRNVKQELTGFLTHYGSGATGNSNCGPRMDPTKSPGTSKYMKYRKG
jgi:putative FmdB family regulatory protein